MHDQPIAVGTADLRGPSSVIESLENLGWRLDQVSWVPRDGAGQKATSFPAAVTGRQAAEANPCTAASFPPDRDSP